MVVTAVRVRVTKVYNDSCSLTMDYHHLTFIDDYLLPSSAQAPAQLIWAELALILFPSAPGRQYVQNSSEIGGNEQNLTK